MCTRILNLNINNLPSCFLIHFVKELHFQQSKFFLVIIFTWWLWEVSGLGSKPPPTDLDDQPCIKLWGGSPKRDCLTSPSTPGGNRVFLGGWPLCTNPRISGGAAPNNPSLEFFKDISMRGVASPPGYPISTPNCPAIWPMFIRPLTSMFWRFCDTDCSMELTSELPTGWLGFPGDNLDNRLCRIMLDWEAYGSPSNDGFSDWKYRTAKIFKRDYIHEICLHSIYLLILQCVNFKSLIAHCDLLVNVSFLPDYCWLS